MALSSRHRVAIVTGGAQGIGRGITKFLLGHTAGYASSGSYGPRRRLNTQKEGVEDFAPEWSVVVVDSDEAGLEDAKALFRDYFSNVPSSFPTTPRRGEDGEVSGEDGPPASSASSSSSASSPTAAGSRPPQDDLEGTREGGIVNDVTFPRVAFVHGDCASEETAKEALQTALERFGRVDLLVNNAGGGLFQVPLRGQTLADFYDVLHRNVGTAYVFSKTIGSHWETLLEKQRAAVATTAPAIDAGTEGAMGGSPTAAKDASPIRSFADAAEGGSDPNNNSASTSSPTREILTPATPASPSRHTSAYAAAGPYGTNMHNAIVNISSTRALQSEHFSESYAAGKGGVVALTHALASSLAHVARVNGINLGWIDVSSRAYGPGREEYPKSHSDIAQHWCNKVGEADDVAHAVLFLYENFFMSGQCITLDGGMTRRMSYVE